MRRLPDDPGRLTVVAAGAGGPVTENSIKIYFYYLSVLGILIFIYFFLVPITPPIIHSSGKMYVRITLERFCHEELQKKKTLHKCWQLGHFEVYVFANIGNC